MTKEGSEIERLKNDVETIISECSDDAVKFEIAALIIDECIKAKRECLEMLRLYMEDLAEIKIEAQIAELEELKKEPI